MDTTQFDTVVRLFGSGMTRRVALRGLVAGAVALSAGGTRLAVQDAAAKKKSSKRKSKKNKNKNEPAPATGPVIEPTPEPAPPVNVCAGKNWCVDRSQTCGPAGGYGKCLVEVSGGNICGELLFQAASCTECAPANCTNCRCVLAAGGGDRCNNGVNGYDFVCVRPV